MKIKKELFKNYEGFSFDLFKRIPFCEIPDKKDINKAIAFEKAMDRMSELEIIQKISSN
jgi:hypothetical protein